MLGLLLVLFIVLRVSTLSIGQYCVLHAVSYFRLMVLLIAACCEGTLCGDIINACAMTTMCGIIVLRAVVHSLAN
jgi:hypothetical protein